MGEVESIGGEVCENDLIGYKRDMKGGLFDKLNLVEGDFVVYQNGEFKESGSDKVDGEKA